MARIGRRIRAVFARRGRSDRRRAVLGEQIKITLAASVAFARWFRRFCGSVRRGRGLIGLLQRARLVRRPLVPPHVLQLDQLKKIRK